MSGLLSLKWNNHTSVFLNLLQNLRNKELYCDTTIVCQGCFYPVHRLVLSSCSEYFEEIFQRAQCKHPFIILKDINPVDLEFLLNYMYKGEVNVVQEALPGLIKAAEALKIKGLAVPDESPPKKDTSSRERKRHLSSCNSQSKRSHTLEGKPRPPFGNNSKKLNDLPATEVIADRINANVDFVREKSNSLVDENFSSHCDDLPLVHTSNEGQDGEINNQAEETHFPHEVCIKSEPTDALDSSLPFNAKDENASFDPLQPDNSELLQADKLPENNPLQSTIFLNQPFQDDVGGPSGINKVRIKSEPSTVTFDSSSEFDAEDENASFDTLQHDNSEMLQANELIETESLESSAFLNQCYPENVGGPSGITKVSQETDMAHIWSNNQFPTTRRAKKKTLTGQCNESFSQTYSMFKHNCSYCSYGSDCSTSVKKHEMRIHTLIKPFPCNFCSYSSTTRPELRIHLRTHTGEKPYHCPYCPHKTSFKNNLIKHIRNHNKL